MRRFLIGLFFVLHGLGHAAVGMAAQYVPHSSESGLHLWLRVVVATALFVLAAPGFIAAGLGAWGVIGLRRWWPFIACCAAIASGLLLLFFNRAFVETALGLILDVLALTIAGHRMRFSVSGPLPTLRGES